jgi:AraC-like DNA-binding protein
MPAPRPTVTTPRGVPVVRFRRTKYGRELDVDAARLSDLPGFTPIARPHALDFYDILLVTHGRGALWIDDVRAAVAPGVVLFTRPGAIRRWEVRGVDGACLFFTPQFIHDVFADARFLDQLAYFAPGRPSAALRLHDRERTEFLARFRAMTAEVGALSDDAPHLLRAVLYDLLIRLNRWYVRRFGDGARTRPPAAVERFAAAVERDFAAEHRVAAYAGRVGLTPGHLNVLCRRHLGRSASRVIRDRLLLEAKRRLLHGDRPVFVVASELGFADAAYFGRFFRRETGETPRAFRRRRATRWEDKAVRL